jgi:hypothetical protein
VPSEPLERVFDKITFRSDFDPSAEYLMLAGRRGGGHMHQDMNAIINLTDNGRLWIVDSSYSLRSPEDHSGVVVLRDGQKLRSKRSAELEAMADLPGAGFTRTVHSGLGGNVAWRRSIIWLKGRFFCVFDEVSSKDKSEYLARCSFRCLGKSSLEGNRFTVTQDGEAFHICSDSAVRMAKKEVEVTETPKDMAVYGHASPIRQVLIETMTSSDLDEQPIVFKNLLSACPDETKADMLPQLTEIASTAALIQLGGEIFLVGITRSAEESFQLGSLSVRAGAFLISSETMALLDMREVALESKTVVRTDRPASVELNLKSGKGHVLSQNAALELKLGLAGSDRVVVDGEQHDATRDGSGISFTIPVGRHAFEFAPGKVQMATPGKVRSLLLQAKERAVRSLAGTDVSKPDAQVNKGLKQAWRVRFSAPITTITHAPRIGILVGLNDARLLCLNEEGVQLWEVRLSARPLKVAARSITGKGALIAAALEDRSVQALDAKGSSLWRFGPLPEAEGRNSYGRSSPNVMRSIAVSDLNGDGHQEVAVGAGYTMALSQTGKLLWSEKHLKLTDGLRNMTVTDLNGDGRIEILAADAWTYPFWYALSHNGQPYWMAAKKMGKPGEMDMKRLQLQGAPLAIASGKYLGTKETQSACVDAKGVLHLADARGNLLGRFNVGEPSPAMASLDLDGDGSDELLAGSESHHLFALTGKCKLKWRVNCGGPVSAIAGLDATPQSQGWVAIAVRQGPLLVADSKGNIKARWLDRARRTTMLIALHPHTDPTAGRIVTGASDGTLVAFEGTGRHGSF